MTKASWVQILSVLGLGIAALSLASNASAVLIGGVDFPKGADSFADLVVLYEPDFFSPTLPTIPNREPSNALGIPEVPGNTSIGACGGNPMDCPFVSLGRGGRLTLEFTNNLLTGSDDASADLWIFEVGPDIEDTFVEISSDGVTWFDVGKVFGTTGGINIDAFGFGSTDTFGFVRLRDDPNEGSSTGASVGADIDAVGAISTIRTAPEPTTLALLAFGLAVMGYRRRRA